MLIYAQDLGGARAILPVIQRLLREQSLSIQVLVHARALRLFSESGIPVIPLETYGYPVPLKYGDALHLMRRLAPDLFFSATSHPRDPSNGYLVAAAREVGIPTVAIVEHWKGHGRFKKSEGGPLLFAPDLLGVMDRDTQQVYVSQGCSPEKVRIVGHPYLERVFHERERWQASGRIESLKRRAGLDPARSFILFCSETVHDHEFHVPCREACLPLSHVQAGGVRLIDLLRQAAAELAEHSGQEIDVLLRAHPNQGANHVAGVRIIDQEAVSDIEAVAMSAAVVGLSTMPLIEAGIIGRPAASMAFFDGWQPSRVFFDPPVWKTQPFFTVLNHAKDLGAFLAASLAGGEVRRLPPAYEQEVLIGATDRCISLIKAGIGIPRAQGASAR